MWIGEQITSRGIGNGVSLIIMAWHRRLDADAQIAQLFEGRPDRHAGSRCWCSASSSACSCW
jgi:hypothetical protein